ncbi:putative quinol monooxygenase [Sphingopyxis soli]|nr:putative quinol monooxygenase [Sphingopyxis soli]
MTGGALRWRPAGRHGPKGETPMPEHVKVVAALTARPGQVDALKALLESMIAPSRAEPGNLRYDLWQDQADPGRFLFDELYIDAAANAAHRETPHFQAYLAQINDLADRTAFALTPVDVKPEA